MNQPTTGTASAREALTRAAFFGALPEAAREQILAGLGRTEVPAGGLVVKEGEEADCYYLIAAGEAEVWTRRGGRQEGPHARDGEQAWSPDPRRHTLLARLGPGDGFGEMALLLGGARRATVRATTPLALFILDGATFLQVVNRHRWLAVALEEEMALRAVAGFLGRASPFGSLPPETLRWLAARLQSLRFEAGQEVFRQGEPGDAFFLVRSGQVEILAEQPDGGEYRLTTLGPGEPFGEQALLTDEPRAATVRALGPTEVLRLRREDFLDVLQQHRDRGNYFLQLVVQRQRPRRIEHWAMERQEARDGEVVFILKDTEQNRYVKLSEQGAFIWDLMDGQRTVRELTLAFFAQYHVFGLDAVISAMLQLHAAGFVRIQRLATERLGKVAKLGRLQRIGLSLLPWLIHYVTLPDVDPLITGLYRRLLHPLYSAVLQGLLLAATLIGAVLFGRALATGGVETTQVAVPGLALATVVGLILQGLLHELGHAVTCKHFGREVHRAGMGWYLFLPVAFVDTSDIWLAGRGQRAAVAFAGPYTNFVLSGLASLTMLLVDDPFWQTALFQFAATGYVLGLVNLNPLLEFDGYYVLMDALDVPNLRAKALAFLGCVLWRGQRAPQEPRLQRIFVTYGLLTLLYTVFVAWSVLTGYQGYVQGTVSQVLPHQVAELLGWGVADLMAWLILQRAWLELRNGAVRTRGVRAWSTAA